MDYSYSGPLRLLFVGTDAVRKGIIPLMDACQKLVEQGLDIQLTFVGGFNQQCYVYGEYLPDTNEIEEKLKSFHWVKYEGRVPIRDVLVMMKTSDLLIFPTFDESLGWVPIEAGLLGVPTIATDIFAIPELIEHEKTGYLISINKRDDDRFVGLNTSGLELEKHLEDASHLIEERLKSSISFLYNNRETIELWGQAAKDKLSIMYDVNLAEAALTRIYNDAIE
jgi:glycosyltransferase involved in cell wall biosynthesis